MDYARSDTHSIDWFALIINDPILQGPLEQFKKRIVEYENRITAVGSEEERLDIRLGIARMKRLRYQLNAEHAKKCLQDVSAAGTQINSMLQLKVRIVCKEIAFFQTGDATTAISHLEPIAQHLATTNQNLLYALTASSLSAAYMIAGELVKAEEFCQDCLSIFRRSGNFLLYAYALNSYGVIRKKQCQYIEAQRRQQQALEIFKALGAKEAQILSYNNLAVCQMKLGNWREAALCLTRAFKCADDTHEYMPPKHRFGRHEHINALHLDVMLRKYVKVMESTSRLSDWVATEAQRTHAALYHEFVAEMYLETGELAKAARELGKAREIALKIAPESDLMTEILRRDSQLLLSKGDLDGAIDTARRCIRLCKKIGDRHELGATLRILGEAYGLQGKDRKAVAALETGIHILKSIGECYELMRTCMAYAEFLIDRERSEADIYLMEARQLCRRLEIDFFLGHIQVLLAKYHHNKCEYMTSRTHLKRAEDIATTLQPCDRDTLQPVIQKLYRILERSILQSTMESAEKLKSLGRLYEDARFPIEELKPEMALEVARNVGADSLFLARKRNRGFTITIRYNIAVNDAKQILRRRREAAIENLFDVDSPTICPLPDGKTLVGVPGKSRDRYVLCTVFNVDRQLSPRELEFLFASVEAMERVAEEYLIEPPRPDVNEFLEEDVKLTHPGGSFKHIVTLDPEMLKLIQLAERASQSNVPILIEGETGVGKELFAKAIHAHGIRRKGEFVAINAGGMPLSLLESQLFGHVKGAFTDAVADRAGLIEDARGGTVFFDEVGEMSEELQVKLLRLLENGEYRRLGENRSRRADVRVVSATNKDLENLMKEGAFREDLYYRLATVKFHIPPLRARRRDIEFLIRHFLNEGMTSIGKRRRRVNVDVKALEALEFYEWPGNIRELRNEIMRNLSLMGDSDLIRFGMLSDRIKDAFSKRSDGGVLTKRVERYERRLILKALDENDWNRIRTAEAIGIPRTTLLFKMKRLNIVS